MTLAIVILAAGQGSRMLSKKQKILHEVGGKPMVQHLFDTAVSLSPHPPVLIIGIGGDGVRQLFGEQARYAVQREQLGTGHATQMALPLLKDQADQVIVTYADMPLLQAETLQRLADLQAETETAVALRRLAGWCGIKTAVSLKFLKWRRPKNGPMPPSFWALPSKMPVCTVLPPIGCGQTSRSSPCGRPAAVPNII